LLDRLLSPPHDRQVPEVDPILKHNNIAHVNLTHPVVSERTTRRSDPYLGFWTPGLLGFFIDPSFQRPTQSGNLNRISSVRTRQFNPPDRVRVNGMPIRSLFGILYPRVVCFDPLDLGFFRSIISTPTQSRNPNRIPSVRTRQFNPPSRVGANDTPIRSLFGILEPRVVCFDPLDLDFL
ncbi:hypothetical protein Taro_038997, partial [Colocasia esculenta]|nr:hypothetical protein [Colocasia esculenta]